MDAESDSSSASDGRRSDRNSNETGQGRQMLLEEARTTANQQLAQIHKLDDEAVRTVRIALVLSGLLVGGAKFLPLPNLGLLGVLGTLSLVGCLVTSLFVYGTSGLFVGPTLDELSFDPEEQSNTDAPLKNLSNATSADSSKIVTFSRGTDSSSRSLGSC